MIVSKDYGILQGYKRNEVRLRPIVRTVYLLFLH